MSKTIYFVIPCYNEGEVLEVTATKLTEKVETLIERGLISKASRITFVDDVSESIRLFSDAMKRLGIKLDGDELYEEFQRIYDESVGKDAGKDKVEDKMWNKGRGR